MESVDPNTDDREPMGRGGGVPMGIASADGMRLLAVGGSIVDCVAVVWLSTLIVLDADMAALVLHECGHRL